MAILKNPNFKENVFAGQFTTVRDSRWRDKELEPGACNDDFGVYLFKPTPSPVTPKKDSATQVQLCDDFDTFKANAALSKPKKEAFGYNFDGKTHSVDVDDTVGLTGMKSPHRTLKPVYTGGEDADSPYDPDSGFGGMDSKDAPENQYNVPNKSYVDGLFSAVMSEVSKNSPIINCKMLEGMDYSVGSPVKVYNEDGVVVAEPISSASSVTQVSGLVAEILDTESISVISAGFLEQEDWNIVCGTVLLVPQQRYYVGGDLGKISTVAPTSGFCACIGHAIDFTKMLIRIEPPIFL